MSSDATSRESVLHHGASQFIQGALSQEVVEQEASGPIAEACQYCSVTSKANGEEPIGTAVRAKMWLFIEVPQPWAKNPWGQESAALLALFQQIEKRPQLWRDLRILAIAPDQAESQPGERHVFFYRQPLGPTATYAAQHYYVPVSQLCALVESLVFQSIQPEHLIQYQRASARALFVCTHTSYDLACGRFGTPLYRTLRKRYAKPDELSVWQTTHFGGHNFAPTLIDFPTGQFWGHLDAEAPEILETLVHRQGDVSALSRFYRGWSGCEKWGQIAERSLWMQQGWAWLATPKTVQVIRQDPGRLIHRLLRWVLRRVPTIRAQILLKKLAEKASWAEVEIRWESSKGLDGGCYRARVEKRGSVVSQMKSGKRADLVTVAQYRVNSMR